MHLPGERTIRGITSRVLRPAVELRRRLGVPALSLRLRREVLDALVSRASRPAARAEDVAGVRLHHRISEPGGYFFSENIISNESAFLVPAPALERLPRGLAYLGVGPEQTFSYLALCGSPLGFVIDVRRDNARLHFLYRAIFEEAGSRSEWLALLLGRPLEAASDPGPNASLDEVLAHATLGEPSRASFRAAHGRLLGRLERLPGLLLPGDRARIARMHRRFWAQQLDITFQIAGPRLRRYPTLRSQLLTRTADGRQPGFLASETSFRAVQELERGGRVVPVVGDLGGDFALRDIGAELRRRGAVLGAIYVSNVEQYLFERGLYPRWVDNLRNLPCHPEALILRAYAMSEDGQPAPEAPRTLLGQIRRSTDVAARAYLHPEKKQVHVMPTIAHRLTPFLERASSYRGFRELVCDADLLWR